MKPNVVAKTKIKLVGSKLTPLPTAKIVSLSRAKKEIKQMEEPPPESESESESSPPDEETLKRLNILAKQHPFCTIHRGRNKPLL